MEVLYLVDRLQEFECAHRSFSIIALDVSTDPVALCCLHGIMMDGGDIAGGQLIQPQVAD